MWDSIAYDPELDLLYIGIGNGSPWNQRLRSPGGGDNLFLSSIVALKPDTGEYVWHYQTTPGDSWDYTATQHIILADLTIDGAPRKVLMQAPKNGFFYVLDRTNGKLISAQPFTTVNWATGVDMKTGRPVENPAARYGDTHKPWFAMPGPLGAHNWQPMSFSPQTDLVYIPAQDIPFPYGDPKAFQPNPIAFNTGIDPSILGMPQEPNAKAQVLASVRGYLKAWDPVTQKEVWRVEQPGAWNGGVLSTAGGLVFEGNAAGTFNAYSADKGAPAVVLSGADGHHRRADDLRGRRATVRRSRRRVGRLVSPLVRGDGAQGIDRAEPQPRAGVSPGRHGAVASASSDARAGQAPGAPRGNGQDAAHGQARVHGVLRRVPRRLRGGRRRRPRSSLVADARDARAMAQRGARGIAHAERHGELRAGAHAGADGGRARVRRGARQRHVSGDASVRGAVRLSGAVRAGGSASLNRR